MELPPSSKRRPGGVWSVNWLRLFQPQVAKTAACYRDHIRHRVLGSVAGLYSLAEPTRIPSSHVHARVGSEAGLRLCLLCTRSVCADDGTHALENDTRMVIASQRSFARCPLVFDQRKMMTVCRSCSFETKAKRLRVGNDMFVCTKQRNLSWNGKIWGKFACMIQNVPGIVLMNSFQVSNECHRRWVMQLM